MERVQKLVKRKQNPLMKPFLKADEKNEMSVDLSWQQGAFYSLQGLQDLTDLNPEFARLAVRCAVMAQQAEAVAVFAPYMPAATSDSERTATYNHNKRASMSSRD